MTLLDQAARIIDEGRPVDKALVNPVTGQLEELADDVAMVAAFSHVVAFSTAEGTALFDVSLAPFGAIAADAVHAWRADRVDTVVYTHGHVDHVGGMAAFQQQADDRGHRRPRVVAHENVPARFDRYRETHGYNEAINLRQFGRGGLDQSAGSGVGFPRSFVPPTVVYDDRLQLAVGDTIFELRHGRGETDDHTWAWVPDHRAVVAGDFFIWMFPNAGNPQKVQRYPGEWAKVLREMAALRPELFLPAHGLPIAGAARIQQVLGDTASALEHLVADTLQLMNEGARLDHILHEVRVHGDLLDRPYLRPLYDEPEFVVRNIWRLYGGWYDGNPARLKPPSDERVAVETARLCGGAPVLARRAAEVAAEGDLRMACHLAELAGLAAPDDPEVHGIRAAVYRARRAEESSLMAKGVFRDAAERSEAIAGDPPA
jgi:alkyl sulfatase BDS1-like metallo-beta-lactamase superfamily hydrolase